MSQLEHQNKFLLLPRGINVGKTNRVAMAELRQALRDAGFGNVRTLLASGNILLTTAEQLPVEIVKEKFCAVMAHEFGIGVPVMIRTGQETQQILQHNPFSTTATDGSKYLVVFFDQIPDPDAVNALLSKDFAPEMIHVRGREAYIWAPNGVAASALSYLKLEKALQVHATARNWNTLEKLVEKMST